MSQSIKIAGKEYQYKRPTISYIRKITKKKYEELILKDEQGLTGTQWALIDEKKCDAVCKQWKAFILDILEPCGLLWIHYVPRKLRFENLEPKEIGAISDGFFNTLAAIQSAPAKQSESSPDSEITKEKT